MTSTCSASDTALPSAMPIFGRSTRRRGFLSGLARLSLVGGVALLGQPPAVAEPVSAASTACRDRGVPDAVFARIEQHRALRDRANAMPGEDEDPAFLDAVDDEESALQALGNLVPSSVAGAAALLAYMAETEGCFIANNGSPLLQTMESVAKGLAALNEGGAHA